MLRDKALGLLPTAPGLVIATSLAVSLWSYRPLDVSIGREAGGALLSGNLAIYAVHPDAQMGPLALVLSGGLPRAAYVVATLVLFAAFLLLAVAAGIPSRHVAGGGMVLAVPWAFFALEGHADDALVLVGVALAVLAWRWDRDWLLVAACVLAVSGKPTGVVLVAVLALRGWKVAASGLAGAAAVWAPFVLADLDGFLAAGSGIALVQPWSAPYLLGAEAYDAFPGWVRPVQLVGGLALCYVIARRAGPAAGLLAAFAWRAALEAGAWPSYSSVPIAVALLLPGRLRAWGVGLAAASWAVSRRYPLDAGEGLLRLLLLAALIVLAATVVERSDQRAGRVDPRDAVPPDRLAEGGVEELRRRRPDHRRA